MTFSIVPYMRIHLAYNKRFVILARGICSFGATSGTALRWYLAMGKFTALEPLRLSVSLEAHPFSHHQLKDHLNLKHDASLIQSVKGRLDWKDIGSWLSCWCPSVPPPTSVRIWENFWVQSQNAHRHSQTQKNHSRSCKCHSQTLFEKLEGQKQVLFLESLVSSNEGWDSSGMRITLFPAFVFIFGQPGCKKSKFDSTSSLFTIMQHRLILYSLTVWLHLFKKYCPSIQKQP